MSGYNQSRNAVANPSFNRQGIPNPAFNARPTPPSFPRNDIPYTPTMPIPRLDPKNDDVIANMPPNYHHSGSSGQLPNGGSFSQNHHSGSSGQLPNSGSFSQNSSSASFSQLQKGGSFSQTPMIPNPPRENQISVLSSAIHEEKHKTSGDFIKSIIYGGLDGIVSVFVTVASASGTQTGVLIALFLGLSKLFAGGISMGIGDWLASGAELDVAFREKQREEWELENYFEGEVEEMVQLYIDKGVPDKSARRIVQILASNRAAFVQIMMAEELGISPSVLSDKPWKHGLVNFISFMSFGIVPLIIFFISIGVGLNPNQTFGLSIAVTVTTLYLIGLIQSVLTGASKFKSAFLTLFLGGITAFVGWLVGFILVLAFPGVAAITA